MTIDVKIGRSKTRFGKLVSSKRYKDRTEMISHLNSMVGTASKYVCITTPKPIGKTGMANMLATYYSNNIETSELFDNLVIAKSPTYRKHLNKYNVIYFDMASLLKPRTMEKYICFCEEKLIRLIKSKYSGVKVSMSNSLYQNLSKVYEKTGTKFIFIIDNWDYIMKFSSFSDKDKKEYLMFLAGFIIDTPYVNLVYITGNEPISTYTKANCYRVFEEYLLG